MRVLAHLLSRLLILHLSAARLGSAGSRSRSILLVSSVSSDFPRAAAGARDRPGTNSISG